MVICQTQSIGSQFEQMLENCLKGNTQELHIHTNGSGKTIDWWWRLLKKLLTIERLMKE